MRRTVETLYIAALLTLVPGLSAASAGSPTLLSGALPSMPPMAAGGGEVLLEALVSPAGEVGDLVTLRTTPGYTGSLREKVAGWRFSPSDEASRVLVIGVFRPPTMRAPAAGAVPSDVAEPSDAVPYPESLSLPPLPPDLWTDAVVMVRIHVDASGAVTAADVVESSPAGAGAAGSAAVSTARSWSFRPARKGGVAVPSVAYAVIGFAQPVIAGSAESGR